MGAAATWKSYTAGTSATLPTAANTGATFGFGGTDDTANSTAEVLADAITNGSRSVRRFFKISFLDDGVGGSGSTITANTCLLKRTNTPSGATGTDTDGNGATVSSQGEMADALYTTGVGATTGDTTVLAGPTALSINGANSEGLLTTDLVLTNTGTGLTQLFALQVTTNANSVAGVGLGIQVTFDVVV